MILDRWTAASGVLALAEISLVVATVFFGRRPLGRLFRALARHWLAISVGALAGIFSGLVVGPLVMYYGYEPLGETWSTRLGVAIAYGLVLVGATRGYMIGALRSRRGASTPGPASDR